MNAYPPPAITSQPSGPLQFGSWCLGAAPAGWELIDGHGIRNGNGVEFPSSVVVGEDTLQAETTLEQYVKAQLVIIDAYLPEARHTEMLFRQSGEADEVASLEIELPAPDGRVGVMRQLYARFGDQVGVVTFTTLASELSRLEPTFESIRADLTFRTGAKPASVTETVGSLASMVSKCC